MVSEVRDNIRAVKSSLSAISGQTPPLASDSTASPSHSHVLAPPTTPSAASSFRTLSEVSTSSSSFQGISSLWLQLLVSKCVVYVYSKESRDFVVQERKEEGRIDDRGLQPIRLAVEAEGVSLQVDVQEKCTDFVLKLAGIESHLAKYELPSADWRPYIDNSGGKVFSSSVSNLPDDILQATAPSFSPSQFQSSGMGRMMGIYSSCFSPTLGSGGFLYMKGYIPLKLFRVPKLEVNVRPFEILVWFPMIKLLTSVFGGSKKKSSKSLSVSPSFSFSNET